VAATKITLLMHFMAESFGEGLWGRDYRHGTVGFFAVPVWLTKRSRCSYASQEVWNHGL
jgi:hypothetical protein